MDTRQAEAPPSQAKHDRTACKPRHGARDDSRRLCHDTWRERQSADKPAPGLQHSRRLTHSRTLRDASRHALHVPHILHASAEAIHVMSRSRRDVDLRRLHGDVTVRGSCRFYALPLRGYDACVTQATPAEHSRCGTPSLHRPLSRERVGHRIPALVSRRVLHPPFLEATDRMAYA